MVRNCWIFMKRHENMDRHKGNSVSFWSPLYSRKLHFVNNLGLIWISNFRLVLVCGKFNKIAFSKILFTVNTLTICKNISRLFMVATLGILLTCNLINYRCVILETVIVVFDQNPQNQFRFDFRTKSWARIFFFYFWHCLDQAVSLNRVESQNTDYYCIWNWMNARIESIILIIWWNALAMLNFASSNTIDYQVNLILSPSCHDSGLLTPQPF